MLSKEAYKNKINTKTKQKLEMFMKHCTPNHLIAHKDAALFLDNDHIKFEASRFIAHHPVSALPIWSFHREFLITNFQWPNFQWAITKTEITS